MSTLQRLRSLSGELEFAHQEIRNLRLEKTELSKEINYLKQQIEEVTEMNDSYLSSLQIQKDKVSILLKTRPNINGINLDNHNLNIQISEYKKLIKEINSNNKNLEKQNKKYMDNLEQLNEEKQKREEIYRNNTLNFQYKIKTLQNECDDLREQINTFSLCSPCSSPSPQIHPISSIDETAFFQIKTVSFNALSDKSIYYELRDNTELREIDNIIHQLIQFGYTEQEIYRAINKINNKTDINDIVEIIDNNDNDDDDDMDSNIDCQCVQFYNEIQSKMAEIDRLKVMNRDNKYIIKSLQKTIRILTRNNKTNVDKSCISFSNLCKIFV